MVITMKEIKELKFEELSARQKLGMATCFSIHSYGEDFEYLLELIRNRSAGAVWVLDSIEEKYHVMEKIKEAADYPILIFRDAESGLGEYKIGCHNAIGMTGSEELAYSFGKVTAVTARKNGFNVVCNPILDMADGNDVCGGNVRSLGNDKYQVAKLAAAIARGMHDGGVLTVGKHYPGSSEKNQGAVHPKRDRRIDSHMAESAGYDTVESLIDYNLYPYRELMNENLLDGIMVGHCRMVNIDPDNPASLSNKVINVIRELGFDGFAITDALNMHGVVAKYGQKGSRGLAVARGNDIGLVWCDTKFAYEAMCEYYDNGTITDERLDEAVRRVLEAQHKAALLPQDAEITDEDIKNFERINSDSVYAKTDDGVPVSIDPNGNHLFVIMTESQLDLKERGKQTVETMNTGWYRPYDIADRLKSLFPNSEITTISQFPTAWENWTILSKAPEHDDVIFITFFKTAINVGFECFTPRFLSLTDALSVTNKISTVIHYGNPYLLEYLHHIPRLIIGTCSQKSVMSVLEVAAGKYPAKGVLTYNLDLE